MKISDNMSSEAFSFQVWSIRAIGIAVAGFLIVKQQSLTNVLTGAGLAWIAFLLSAENRPMFLLEVFDLGDRLKMREISPMSYMLKESLHNFLIRSDGVNTPAK